ncbi:MAG: DegT/DnrJ/EryC1/StrS aminotransferase [Anaerolineae bacterium UTCFX2]|jgi:dTDP-4-amino-4,6-dideoxygalactose transaminase|nr:DegT/DnrJ/EryC1/StrS family aminotransferase [Anaerolineales bacterium]OQY88162.1 MAG: DegT/DnrJ/EryC1/StrS aminotransferase [Anaerolineae bacterium UTCFX2]
MNWRVPLADLDYGEDEQQAVLDVLRSRWLTMGSVTRSFEERFAEMHGARFAFGVVNATTALHLACLALGIGPGDEVIVPSLSFVATSNAVLYTGAQVQFAEVLGAHDLTIDPAEIRRLANARTRAVIVMHYGGYPCHMLEITETARQLGLAVIEDAAHSPGAALQGRSLGTWGEFGCFSFFSNKNLSTGEGGMLVTDRADLAQKAQALRSHGMTSLTWDRHQGHAYSYDVVELGYNYRIDEIHSALGLAQLNKLAANNQRRMELSAQYRNRLQETPLFFPFEERAQEPGICAAGHIFPVLLPEGVERRAFMDHLRAAGVQSSIHYPPIHQFTYYRERYPQVSLPLTESLSRREVTLPLYPTMSTADLDLVVESCLRFFDRPQV